MLFFWHSFLYLAKQHLSGKPVFICTLTFSCSSIRVYVGYHSKDLPISFLKISLFYWNVCSNLAVKALQIDRATFEFMISVLWALFQVAIKVRRLLINQPINCSALNKTRWNDCHQQTYMLASKVEMEFSDIASIFFLALVFFGVSLILPF